jgi:hypothetical protein
MPPHLELIHSTPYTLHRGRHDLPRHGIAAALSHLTIFDLDPHFKFGDPHCARVRALPVHPHST